MNEIYILKKEFYYFQKLIIFLEFMWVW